MRQRPCGSAKPSGISKLIAALGKQADASIVRKLWRRRKPR
jgi:hypothetical protein